MIHHENRRLSHHGLFCFQKNCHGHHVNLHYLNKVLKSVQGHHEMDVQHVLDHYYCVMMNETDHHEMLHRDYHLILMMDDCRRPHVQRKNSEFFQNLVYKPYI
jgi:hypothetical protein